MKTAPQQFSFKTVLQLKPEECSRTQSSYPSKTYTLHGTHQQKIYISKSFPQHSSDPKTRPNIRDSCKSSRNSAIAPSLSARHPGAVPRVSCTSLIQLSVSLYTEIELLISVYHGQVMRIPFPNKICFNWLCWSSQRSIKMGLR